MSKVLILVLVAIGLPVVLVFSSVRLLRSKRSGLRWLALVPISVLAFMALQVYWALYPREEFYREKWLQHTGFMLPDEVVFLSKSATYPDQHGDYWAGAIIQASPTKLDEIERQLQSNKHFTLDTSMQRIGIAQEFRVLVKELQIAPLDPVYRSDSLWVRVAFLKKQGIVIFERCSS